MRAIATSKAARGLADDAAILPIPLGLDLVATHDMLAEDIHFTPDCPPVDIGWKLAAVNLSDLASMGARPLGVLMGAGIGDGRGVEWATEILRGMHHALEKYGAPLLGGDTIRSGPATVLALTALGSMPPGKALSRNSARAGDELWVSGTIGDAGLGLEVARGQRQDEALLKRYRRPTPRIALGLALRDLARAAIDVSDGLLLDAARLAESSGLCAEVESALIPLSDAARASGVAVGRLAAMGDDYELLFTCPPEAADRVRAAAEKTCTPITRIGRMQPAQKHHLLLDGMAPQRLGHRHE